VTPHKSFSGVICHACALVLLCTNQHTKFEVPSFIDSKYMIWAKFKRKMGHMTLPRPLGSSLSAKAKHYIFYLHTKFGDCCFSRSRDMIARVETEI